MAWIYLIIAGSLEVAWTYAMKLSEGFTRPWPTLVMALTMAASLGLLTIAVRTLPLGTAYAVWTGIGAVGAFVVGVTALGEQASVTRLVAAALIVSEIVMMKLGGAE